MDQQQLREHHNHAHNIALHEQLRRDKLRDQQIREGLIPVCSSSRNDAAMPYSDMQPSCSFRAELLETPHNSSQSQINTTLTFPPSTQPFLFQRSKPLERSMTFNGFFMNSSNTSNIALAGSAMRHELAQLGREDISESSLASSAGKLQDDQGVPSLNPRYGDNNLLRFSTNHPMVGGEGLWPYPMSNDLSEASTSVQLPMNIGSGQDLHAYTGTSMGHLEQNTNISPILPVSRDQARAGSYAHNSAADAAWANEGTELLLLPGITGDDQPHHHHHHHHQAPPQGKISASHNMGTLKPLSEYLNPHADHDQNRQASANFQSFPAPPGGSFRDLSLSLSAQQNSQQLLYHRTLDNAACLSVAESFCHLRSSIYLKAAQQLLNDLCKIERSNMGATSSQSDQLVYNQSCGSLAGGMVNTIISNANHDAGFINRGVVGTSLHALQQSTHDPVPNLAHLQLDRHISMHNLQLDRHQLELKRKRLVVMLEELDKRYRRYEEQMRVVVMPLETSGAGLMLEGAAPYREAAGLAMQRHFRCLRDAIANEVLALTGFSNGGHAALQRASRDAINNNNSAMLVSQWDQASPTRLRLLDQQLRHQRALQQAGLFQQPWRPQRGLPELSVSVLRAWLFEHFLHPYPKDTVKLLLARQTGLTRNQVSNWFINARVRLWKPLVEEMYQEEMKAAELRHAAVMGNPIESNPTLHLRRANATISNPHHFHGDQSEKHGPSEFSNHVIAMQDLASMDDMGMEASKFHKHTSVSDEYLNDNQTKAFGDEHQQHEQVSFVSNMEGPSTSALATVLEAQQCVPHTWPFIQHQSVSLDAHPQQHYSNSNSAAMMRFGNSGGVTLTLGLQQHSGGGAMHCAGPAPFDRSPTGVDDVDAGQRWCG